MTTPVGIGKLSYRFYLSKQREKGIHRHLTVSKDANDLNWFVVFIGKKVKRSGEAGLFHEGTGKLNDDALTLCRVLGINP